MAVDIKQLRIGSHVEVNGVRARVETFRNVRLSICDAPHAIFTSIVDGEKRECGCFLDGEVNGVRRKVLGLGCGRVSSLPHPVNTEVNPIPITPELLVELGFELTGDWGEYKIYSKKNVAVRLVGERVYVKVEPNLGALYDIKYLHELENFIYLTLGKELIEE